MYARGERAALSDPELQSVLARAREEQWTELALVGRRRARLAETMLRDGWSPSRLFLIYDLPSAHAKGIAAITSLESLVIGGDRREGRWLGDDGAELIASLEGLGSLRLEENGIQGAGAEALAALRNLTSLHLDGNAIGPQGARAIAALEHLTTLHLDGNAIGPQGARAIAALEHLTTLHLQYNELETEGARAVASLANLTTLDLSNNGIGVEGMRAIAALERLSSLHLAESRRPARMGIEGARAIASLTRLTTLDLGNNAIGPEGARAIASLGSLTSLALGGNRLGDEGARVLTGLTNLASLRLGSNEIGDEGARALAGLTNLASLDLGFNEIGDEGARALAGLTNLASLRLGHNRLGREGAKVLASLPRLTTLALGDNAIGDEGARAIAGLTNLTGLQLERAGIGDEGARAIADLTNLASWSLDGNRVTQSSLFRAMPRLQALCLDHNPLHDVPLWLIEGYDCFPVLQGYWHDLEQAATSNDSVVIVLLGDPGVGKTTLAHCLAHGHAPPQASGKRMQGPRLQRCELALPGGARLDARIIDCNGDLPVGWDSFSTVHCIVLVVWAQGSEAKPGEWFQRTQHITGRAVHEGRLILVENRIDEPRPPADSSDPPHPEPLPDRLVQVAVSTLEPRGLDALRTALAGVVERTRSPWIHPIPTSWHAVRRTLDEWRDPAAHGLDAPARDQLEYREFEALCVAHGIAGTDGVARFLFRTGVLLDQPRRPKPIKLKDPRSGRSRAKRKWYSTPLVDREPPRDRSRFPALSDREVLEALARAREERWTELALVDGYAAAKLEREGWPRSRILVDRRLPLERARDIARVATLRSLVLGGDFEDPQHLFETPALEDERARALASLATLVDLGSLVVDGIFLGPRGARAIASLTSLTALALERCFIGSEGARALAGLTNLTSLDLRGNVIDDDGAQALASLGRLTSLGLGWNDIRGDGAKALAALAKLTSLDLDGNDIGTYGVRALAGLPRLATLRLAGREGAALEANAARALARATSLTSLHLGRNRLGNDGARALADLAGLTSLDLAGNGIGDDGARALAALTHLTSLDLGNNDIGDDGARALASLSHLTSLDLGSNDIGDDGARALASLGSLTVLDLGGNDIGDDGARALASLGSLTALDLGGNDLGDDGARALASLERLISLDLGGNAIGDDGIRALASLSRLEYLRLSRSGLRATAGEALASLTRLSVLDLDGNDLGTEGAAALARLGGLTSLRLSGNRIGDGGAQALAGLSRLASLHLENNGIGNDGARALAALGNLTQLELQRNDITSATIFRAMPWLEVLHLGNNPIRDVFRDFIHAEYSLPELTAYWRDLDQGATTNDTIKVFVMGEAGVGKTMLVHWLVHGHAPPAPVGTRILGPALQRSELTLPDGQRVDLRIVDCKTSKYYPRFEPCIVVRVWAGERHGASTLHTLDIDREAEEGRLLVVENRFGASSEPPPPEPNVTPERPAAPRVVVDAATGTGIDELRAALAQVIASARAQWAYPIPTSWRTVRVTLERWRDPAAHGLAEAPLERITEERFVALCGVHGIEHPHPFLQYLSSVGVVSRNGHEPGLLRLIPTPQASRTEQCRDAAP